MWDVKRKKLYKRNDGTTIFVYNRIEIKSTNLCEIKLYQSEGWIWIM